jgi:hypothetical protein
VCSLRQEEAVIDTLIETEWRAKDFVRFCLSFAFGSNTSENIYTDLDDIFALFSGACSFVFVHVLVVKVIK